MTKITYFFKSLIILFMPRYWIMNYEYSPEWDRKFNMLLDKYDFVVEDEFTALLGNERIWISNMPYAAFRPYTMMKTGKFRPSRLTIFRAERKYNANREKDPYLLYKKNN